MGRSALAYLAMQHLSRAPTARHQHQPVAQSGPAAAMGFDEEIGDHIPGLVREFVAPYHHRIPFR